MRLLIGTGRVRRWEWRCLVLLLDDVGLVGLVEGFLPGILINERGKGFNNETCTFVVREA